MSETVSIYAQIPVALYVSKVSMYYIKMRDSFSRSPNNTRFYGFKITKLFILYEITRGIVQLVFKDTHL